MFQHVNPIGISVSQAKKDAKKLSKQLEIPLSKAQDKIAFKHNRSTWAESLAQTRQIISLDFKASPLGSQQILFPQQASLSFILGKAGSGKSVLSFEIMSQLAKRKIPSTYLSTNIGNRIDIDGAPDWAKYQNLLFDLQEKYPQLIQVFDLNSSIDLDDIALHGGVLIVDEAFVVLKHPNIDELLRASKHTFVVAQSYRDLTPIPIEILQKNAMQLFCFGLPVNDLVEIHGVMKGNGMASLSRFHEAFLQLNPERNVKSSFLYGGNNGQVNLLELSKESISIWC